MADKRISQLVDRGTVANNDVVPIVVSGATTTNKATISSIQTFMQGNLDLGVTSVGITLGSSGTDVSVSGSPITSSGNITINLPTASATNRGLLSAADWVTFNSKQDAGSFVTLDTTQTITAQKTFTTSGSSDTMIISHGSGSGFALDVLKAGDGEAIRVTKTSGSGNAMTISGGNFEAGTIVKTGGTSSQFLKADGSVDSNTYLTTGSAGSTYVPYSGAAASVNLGVHSITANAINSAGSGSTAGQINLRSDAFFSLVNGYGSIASGTTNQFNLYQTTGAGVFRGAILSLNSITASATRTYTLPDASGTLALSTDLGAYLPLAGGTLTGALNGTSASFTGAVTSQGLLTIGNISSGLNSIIAFANTGNPSPRYLYYKASNGSINVTNDSGIDQFTILNSGNVGIGLSSLVSPGGSRRLLQISNSTNGAQIALGSSTSESNNPRIFSGQFDLGFAAGVTTGNIDFYTNDSLRMRITSGGNVGIGVTPSAWATSNDVCAIQLKAGTFWNYSDFSTYFGLNYYWDGSVRKYIISDYASEYQQILGEHRWFSAPSGTAGNTATFTERMRITSDAYLRMASGSGGIQFNGDTAAANALDDYEEGTWTPVIGGSGGESGQSYSGQTGNYTKIGRLVMVNFRVVLSNKGTITGDVVIKGLPFTVQNSITFGGGATYWGSFATSWNSIFFEIGANETYARVAGTKSAVTESIKCVTADINNSTQFNGSFTYFTA